MYGEVVEITRIAPRMVRVVIGGGDIDQFVPTEFSDQYTNVLFVPKDAPYAIPFDVDAARSLNGDYRPTGRRYTIRRADASAHTVTIDFVVHGDIGTAGRWAQHANIGDAIQFEGVSGGYRPDASADWHLLAGDESCLPAIAASLESLEADAQAIAVILVDNETHQVEIESNAAVNLIWVHRDSSPGDHSLLPAAVRELELPEGRPHVFVHGEAGETRAIRKYLLGDCGIAREHTSISPYWRRDYTDERWREVKKDWLAEVALDV